MTYLVVELVELALELIGKMLLALVVKVETKGVKVPEDLLRARVLFDATLVVKADHCAGGDRRRDLELFREAVLFGEGHVLGREVDDKVNRRVRVVLFEILHALLKKEEATTKKCSTLIKAGVFSVAVIKPSRNSL